MKRLTALAIIVSAAAISAACTITETTTNGSPDGGTSSGGTSSGGTSSGDPTSSVGPGATAKSGFVTVVQTAFKAGPADFVSYSASAGFFEGASASNPNAPATAT